MYPTVSQHNLYPVIVAPSPNGFILNPVDFENLSVEADNIQYGIQYLQTSISQKLACIYPPTPTSVNEIILNQNEFVVMITI